MNDTSWTNITKEETGWQEDSLASTTVLVDDLVCLVDDPVILVDGYDPIQYSKIIKINKTTWS